MRLGFEGGDRLIPTIDLLRVHFSGEPKSLAVNIYRPLSTTEFSPSRASVDGRGASLSNFQMSVIGSLTDGMLYIFQ